MTSESSGTETEAKPSVSAYLRLVLLGAAIGIPAALLALFLLQIIHELQVWLWVELPHMMNVETPPWYFLIGLPVVGAIITVIARKFLPGDGGPSPLGHVDFKTLKASHGFGIILALVGSLGFGAVLGPEAPLVALGSVVGLVFLLFVKLRPTEAMVVSSAGSFSAISSILGGPIVAGVFIMEAALRFGRQLIPILLPGFVSAAVGYLVFTGVGNYQGIDNYTLTVPNLSPYEGTSISDVLLAVVMGVVIAFIIFLVRKFARGIASQEGRLGVSKLLLLGGLALGLVVWLATLFGVRPQDVLFSGQNSLPLAFQSTIALAFVLLIAKSIAFSISLGSGFRGGAVFPASFLGVAAATIVAMWFDISLTWAMAVGVAAGFAAMTGFLLSSVLFAALLVGSYGHDAIPSAVLAAAAAWFTILLLEGNAKKEAQPV